MKSLLMISAEQRAASIKKEAKPIFIFLPEPNALGAKLSGVLEKLMKRPQKIRKTVSKMRSPNEDSHNEVASP